MQPADSEFEAEGLLRSASGAPADDESQLMRVYATDPNDPDSSDETVSEEDVWRRK